MSAKGRNGGSVRIIGGSCRGRRLSFPDLPGLRPTGDRIRETLFNWLQPQMPGARCLDLFAGSGALGLEAASRGAGQVVMLDRSPAVIHQLKAHAELLGLEQVQVVQADALTWLQEPPAAPFDIVFLDPPFGAGLIEPCCQALVAGDWLQPQGRLYIETALKEPLPALPPGWQLLREKRAGQVAYYLVGG